MSMEQNRITALQGTVEDLRNALERAELRLQQSELMNTRLKLHVSQLESIVITVRNAVTPRGQQKPSAEMESCSES